MRSCKVAELPNPARSLVVTKDVFDSESRRIVGRLFALRRRHLFQLATHAPTHAKRYTRAHRPRPSYHVHELSESPVPTSLLSSRTFAARPIFSRDGQAAGAEFQSILDHLGDHRRHQKRYKRGGGIAPAALDDLIKAGSTAPVAVEDLLTLEAALTKLEALDPRGASCHPAIFLWPVDS